MILFPVVDSKAKVNRLHIMLGPESDEYFMLFGSQAFDMSEVQKQIFTNNLPTHIILTRVTSELAAGMLVNKMVIQNKMSEFMGSMAGGDQSHNSKDNMKDGLWAPDLICPKCLQKGVYLKSGEQTLCKDCLKIEKGIGNPKKKKGDSHENNDPKSTEKKD